MRPERSPSSAVMTLSPSACRAWDGSHPTFPSRSSSPGVGVLLFLAGLGAGRSKLLSVAVGRLGNNTVRLQNLVEKRSGGEGPPSRWAYVANYAQAGPILSWRVGHHH